MSSEYFSLEVGDDFNFDHVDQVDSKFPDLGSSLDAWDGEISTSDIPTGAIEFRSDDRTLIMASAPDTATEMLALGVVATATHDGIAAAGPAGPSHFDSWKQAKLQPKCQCTWAMGTPLSV